MTSAGTRGGWPRRAWVEIPPEEGWEPVAGPWGRAGCPGWGRLPASFPPSIRPSVRPSPPGSTGQLPARRLCPGEPPSPHQRVPRAMALSLGCSGAQEHARSAQGPFWGSLSAKALGLRVPPRFAAGGRQRNSLSGRPGVPRGLQRAFYCAFPPVLKSGQVYVDKAASVILCAYCGRDGEGRLSTPLNHCPSSS